MATAQLPQQVSTDAEETKCCICGTEVEVWVQCPHSNACNRHFFCKKCITSFTLERQFTSKCPRCKEYISQERLTELHQHCSRFLDQSAIPIAGNRRVSCRNAEQGCRVQLDERMVPTHAATCQFERTACTIARCSAVVTRQDLATHVRDQCPKRHVRCGECGLTMTDEVMSSHGCRIKNDIDTLKKRVNDMAEKLDTLCLTAEFARMRVGDVAGPITSCFQERCDVMVIGGCDGNHRLTSVEVYDWSKGAWVPGPPMKDPRSGMPAFHYKQRILVAGGKDKLQGRDRFEVLGMTPCGALEEWHEFEARLQREAWCHSATVYEDSLIVIGGRNYEGISQDIYQLRLTEKYSNAQFLCSLPKPLWNHSAQRIGDKIYIFGGMTGNENKHSVANVWEYDITGNKLRELRPLPHTLGGHASVRVGENEVIIVGGCTAEEGRLRSVLKYNVLRETYTNLPPMHHARDGCAAVLTGNALVVMGGLYEDNDTGFVYLKSAECFNFATYEWKDLPLMSTERSYPTAIVKHDSYHDRSSTGFS